MVEFIRKKESAPFPRTNRQASSLVPRCGVLTARFPQDWRRFLFTINNMLTTLENLF